MIPPEIVPQLPAVIIVAPLVAALIVAMLRNRHVAWLISYIVSWLMVPVSFELVDQVIRNGPISYAMGGWEPPLGIEYRVDAAASYILLLVSAMGALTMTFAPRSLTSELPKRKVGLYYAMYLTCFAGLMGMVITGDAFNIFVFMEISSLAMYAMIAMGKDRRALVAAFQYLIIGTIGATFYVIGIGFLFALTGTLNLVDMAIRLEEVQEVRSVVVGFGFIIVGIGLKLAIFPLHLWLPNAYAYAPSAASAFLASTATKVAVYLLLRFLFSIFHSRDTLPDYEAFPIILLVMSAVAMIVAAAVAIFQTNVKRMLAYSSVSQIGYITLGIALVSQTGVTGGMAHVFNHAIIKACLFFAVGAIVYRTGIVKIEEMAGIGRRMPLTMFAFVIAGLGLIGVPGTAGFVSKWYLILGAVEQELWILVAVIVVSSLMAVFYIGRIIEVAWFREPGPKLEGVREPPAEQLAVIWVLVLMILVFGFFTDISVGIAEISVEALLDGYGPEDGGDLIDLTIPLEMPDDHGGGHGGDHGGDHGGESGH